MKNKLHLKLIIVFAMVASVVMPLFLIPLFKENYQLIINPVLWIMLATLTYFVLPKYHHKFDMNRYDVRQYALIGALLYIIIYFASGIIIGYTNSPYDRSILGIIKNLWMIESVVITKEFVRAALFKTTTKQDKWFTLIFVTIVFVFLDLNLYTLGNVFENISVFMGFLTKNLIAAVVINAFVSYLTYRDGLKAALLFQIPYTAIFLLTPVFPANMFAVLLVIETVIPLLIYLKIEKEYKKNNMFGLSRKQTTNDIVAHYFTVAILIILITFSLGLLPYVPMVIASNSMYPLIERGDIVVTKKILFDKIEINDIIEYRLNNIFVVHRVTGIVETAKGRFLITKGDNNSSIDHELVGSDQIKGIIVANIPKLGYPTLWLRDAIGNNDKDVDVETGRN